MGVNFIERWKRVLGASILKPKRREQYRTSTRQRVHKLSAWAGVNPGVSKSWGKKGIRQHAKWAAKRRISEKQFADRQHMLHDVGLTAPKMLSPRALRRSLQRVAI